MEGLQKLFETQMQGYDAPRSHWLIEDRGG